MTTGDSMRVKMDDHAWVWFDCDLEVWVMDCPDCEIRYELLAHVDHLQAVGMANLHNTACHSSKGQDNIHAKLS